MGILMRVSQIAWTLVDLSSIVAQHSPRSVQLHGTGNQVGADLFTDSMGVARSSVQSSTTLHIEVADFYVESWHGVA